MGFEKSEVSGGLEDGKMNSHYQTLLNNNKKDTGGSGKSIQEIPHVKPTSGQNPTGPMKGDLMNWTQMLESIDEIEDNIDQISSDDNIGNASIDLDDETPAESGQVNEQELLDKLNQIFTPILVMQGFEGDMSGKIQEAFAEASVLMERNIINFDDETRMAQLVSTCALLISQQKNTEKFKMYNKAAAIRNKMKLDIQKDEYDAAKALAQKFLVKVSTTNNSSFARDAATNLLPETQH